jgi:hypothetical protein
VAVAAKKGNATAQGASAKSAIKSGKYTALNGVDGRESNWIT